MSMNLRFMKRAKSIILLWICYYSQNTNFHGFCGKYQTTKLRMSIYIYIDYIITSVARKLEGTVKMCFSYQKFKLPKFHNYGTIKIVWLLRNWCSCNLGLFHRELTAKLMGLTKTVRAIHGIRAIRVQIELSVYIEVNP